MTVNQRRENWSRKTLLLHSPMQIPYSQVPKLELCANFPVLILVPNASRHIRLLTKYRVNLAVYFYRERSDNIIQGISDNFLSARSLCVGRKIKLNKKVFNYYYYLISDHAGF